MAKIIKSLTIISFCLFIISIILFTAMNNGIVLSFAITFGTFFYHFSMRILVGTIVNKIMKNKADYNKKWFKVGDFEVKIYEFLNVKQWKVKSLSYEPDLFDKSKHTWDEIAQAMCQAEIVHEIIVVLSFLPIFASLLFGEFFVFLLTSIFSALFDFSFVILQRYNRPRILRLLNKTHKV